MEIMSWRRTGCGPLQRSAITPWIIGFDLWRFLGNPDIDEERNHGESEKCRAHSGDHIHGRESIACQVIGVTARESFDTKPVLNQECGVETDEKSPEVNLAQSFIEHPPGHL